MAKRAQRMKPADFEVNRTWLVYRLNRIPMLFEGSEVDVYVLQDAASMYLFGHMVAAHGADGPAQAEVERVMLAAHGTRDEWPDELVLPAGPAKDSAIALVAEKHGVSVRVVPQSWMSYYIGDARRSFKQFMDLDAGED